MSRGEGSWLRPVSIVAAALPSIALLACVAIAVAFHAEDTLSTHCRNVNRLPSISAAVGQLQPERRIWAGCIAGSCALRLLVALGYHQEMSERLAPRRPQLVAVAAHLGVGCVELLSLLGLSLVASSDDYAIHQNCFVTFLLSSVAYMLLHLGIAAQIRSSSSSSTAANALVITTRSFIAKLLVFAAYCACILLAAYFFARHQAYCEDMMYTYFAATEYAVVYANILFHFTAYFDLGRLPIRLIVGRALAGLGQRRRHHKSVASPLARRRRRPEAIAVHSSECGSSWEARTLASMQRRSATVGFDTRAAAVSADSHLSVVAGL